jgi:hypothetical protein
MIGGSEYNLRQVAHVQAGYPGSPKITAAANKVVSPGGVDRRPSLTRRSSHYNALLQYRAGFRFGYRRSISSAVVRLLP